MSTHVAAWAAQQTAGSPAKKLILVVLADNANDDGWLRWPQPFAVRVCEMTKSTFDGHVKDFIAGGVMEIVGPRGGQWARIKVPWEDESV